jgi:hypothetical protein
MKNLFKELLIKKWYNSPLTNDKSRKNLKIKITNIIKRKKLLLLVDARQCDNKRLTKNINLIVFIIRSELFKGLFLGLQFFLRLAKL